MLKDEKLNLDLYQNLNSNQAPEDFHHVAFKTINYDAMVDFYTKLFGCKPLYESEELTFLAFDEEHHRVAIANTSGVFKKSWIYSKNHHANKKLDESLFAFNCRFGSYFL